MELLAPAGDLEKLKIAVIYGADAVFVGGHDFSLRSRASNFTFEELKEGAEFCHKHNAKLYVTTNIIPHNNDLIGLVDYLQELEKCNIDAIIASSFAIVEAAKKYTNLDVHISTQQSLTNSEAVQFYKDYGLSRVVLARELSISQIKKIKDNVDIELEVFIHGGMCSSYSGKCMLSNNMTTRDANRGGCAHSCRWNYRLYEDDKEVTQNYFFAMSSKDLSAVRQLPKLINAKVDSFKIEGRMKSLHYIATVVSVYRKLIDEYKNTKTIKDYEKYENEIKKCENRLTSIGWLEGKLTANEQLYNMRSEQPTQEFVGIVKGYDEDKKKYIVEVRNHFKPNSKLEILSPSKDTIQFKIKTILDENLEELDAARHPLQLVYIDSKIELNEYDFLRLVK
ncbi:MAG: U32 family peptidase [bacterium]